LYLSVPEPFMLSYICVKAYLYVGFKVLAMAVEDIR
jgi:hypothetical protein